jgi:hypothetical protein
MIMTNNAPAAGDFCDFQVQRNTSFTGGSGALTAVMRVLGSYGAGDASGNWNFVSQAQSSGSGGIALGAFLTAQRVAGSNPVFGAVLNGNDTTGLASASGSAVVGVEIDCECQLQDNSTNASMLGGTGNRIGANVVAVRHNSAITSPPTEVSAGVWFTSATNPPTSGTSDPYTAFLSAIAFGVGLQAYQALDTRAAIVPTGVAQPFAAVRMAHEQIIDFNGGTTLKAAAGNYLQYTTSGTPRLRYMAGSSEVLGVDNTGNTTLNGLTASGVMTANSGMSFGANTAPGGVVTDLSKHIMLYNPGYGISVTGGALNFIVGGQADFTVSGGAGIARGAMQVGGATGPTWSTGAAAPAATAPVGSLYSRVGGAVGATLYVSRGGGTWAAVAGV